MNYKAARGTTDVLDKDVLAFNSFFSESRRMFNLFGYKEIITPVFEDTALFVRSLGDFSEIVTKQMLNLKTSEEKPLSLRPEGTAGVVRAYLENNIDKTQGFCKLFYIGPMFRGERPQKGRLRQFNHIGAEAIGSNNPAIDAEVIYLAIKLIDYFKITGYSLLINCVGCQKDKQKLNSLLKDALDEHEKELCADCQIRLSKNVLRILDCKNKQCKDIVSKIDFKDKYLCPDCFEHYGKVKSYLNSLGVSYQESPHLVRGLDYYTSTVFEIINESLGSQNAIGAGGRYDNLVQEIGGADIPAVGFALGVERLLLALKAVKGEQFVKDSGIDVFIAVAGEEFFKNGFEFLNELRSNGLSADMDYTARSLKSQMRRADSMNVSFVAFIGQDEISAGKATIKNMRTGDQLSVGFKEAGRRINQLKSEAGE